MTNRSNPAPRFPDSVVFSGWYAPSRVEADVHDLEVEGRIPDGLEGAYYKASADPQYPPMLGDGIYLDGDGMVSMVRLVNGRAHLKTRYVRTPRFLAERAAQRGLFGHYRNPYFDDPSVAGIRRGTANTAIGWHAGKLFALKEDSPPMQIDPVTLDTLGYHDFGGRLPHDTFTAHPKTDPETGEMIAFSYNAEGVGSQTIWVHVVSPDGQHVKSEYFEAPYSSMVHDFLVSRHYIVFTIHPMINDIERTRRGEQFFNWMPERGAKIAVIPRAAGVGGLRWFDCPSAVMEAHTINAFDDNGVLYLDHDIQRSGWFSQFPWQDNPQVHEAPPFAERWRLDLNRADDRYDVRVLSDDPGEFPTVDPRYLMKDASHVFMGCINPKLGPMLAFGPFGPPFNAISRIDTRTGERTYYHPGPDAAVTEPTFIPKSVDAAEGDGWLVLLVERRAENRNDLVIVDTALMTPVATVKFPFRTRYGFHGKWLSAAELGW